jgi:hypothetical protein
MSEGIVRAAPRQAMTVQGPGSRQPAAVTLTPVTTFDGSLLAVDIVLTGAFVALIVLAAVVFVRHRRTGTARMFGRAIHRPRLWAAAAACGGVAGLLFEARERMPSSWQESSLNILGVLQLASFVLLFTHIFSQVRAKRRSIGEPQPRP